LALYLMINLEASNWTIGNTALQITWYVVQIKILYQCSNLFDLLFSIPI